MNFQFAAFCDQGRVRTTNEDAAIIDGVRVREQRVLAGVLEGTGDHLLLVADGVGGHVAGDLASAMVVEHLAVDWRRRRCRFDLLSAAGEANLTLYQNMTSCSDLRGMGSTLAGVHIYEATLRWVSVGDSRIYLFRDGAMRQLSTDHATGESDIYPPGTLTQCLGGNPTFVSVEPAFGEERLRKADTVLICTDGVSAVLAKSELASACACSDVRGVGERLVSAVMARGAPDNLTFIVLRPLHESAAAS